MILVHCGILRAPRLYVARFAIATLILVSSGFLALEAKAEPIPSAYLQMDYHGCIAAEDSKWMKTYCRCFVTEIERNMQLEEYLEVSQEISERLAAGASGSDVLTSNRTFINAVESCAREAG